MIYIILICAGSNQRYSLAYNILVDVYPVNIRANNTYTQNKRTTSGNLLIIPNLLNTLNACPSCIGVESLLSTLRDSSNQNIRNKSVTSDIPAETNPTPTYHRCWTENHPIAGPIIIDIPNTAPIIPNILLLLFPCVISERYAIATPLFHQVIPSIILENNTIRRGRITPAIGM